MLTGYNVHLAINHLEETKSFFGNSKVILCSANNRTYVSVLFNPCINNRLSTLIYC